MGNVTYPDGIAIWKVVYYTPALFASVYICCRHGFLKSSGWFFLVTFCLTRLIGSCAQLATISHVDQTAETIALVCTLMGTSPLLLSSLGLLSRIYYSILSQFWSIVFQLGILKIVQTPAIIGFILCIVGATSASNPTLIEHEPTVRAGIILYLVVFLMLCVLALIAVCCRNKVPQEERIFIKAIVLALPFILIHIVYSLCAAFADDTIFNPATGSTTVSLFMSVLEEMAVVAIYVYAGLKTRSTPLPEGTSAPRERQSPRKNSIPVGIGLNLIILTIGKAAHRIASVTVKITASKSGTALAGMSDRPGRMGGVNTQDTFQQKYDRYSTFPQGYGIHSASHRGVIEALAPSEHHRVG